MPKSWVDMHLPLVADHAHRSNLLDFEKTIYQESLQLLLSKFCRLLWHLEQAFSRSPHDQFSFRFGSSLYPRHFLQRRNAELLAVILINLNNICPYVRGFANAFRDVREVVGFRFLESRHLIFPTVPILAENLSRSFSAYTGKNSLLVVTSDTTRGEVTSYPPAYANLEKFGVRTIGLGEATNVQRPQRETTTRSYLVPGGDVATAADDDNEKYSPRDIESASRIQKFWRRFSPRLKDLRLWRKDPYALCVDFFITLGKTVASKSNCITTPRQRLEIRLALVTDGVNLQLELTKLEVRIKDLRDRTTAILENDNMSFEQMKGIDDISEDLRKIEERLENAKDSMAEDVLGELVRKGVVREVKKGLGDVECCVVDVDAGVKRVSGMIGSLP
ncbi:hypothetical protein GP486_004562 [Trichoglossum hirsutum]|uniref:Uncharacterized protein n=1 Tax=Trichoglossum hirsutum TaxID=265104 RepID=A0A9P8LAY6_9PEZI|nr:hypothetical protein GP486_004562 [Trichoglossum hirsutum]